MNTYNVITCNYVKMYDTLLRLSMQVLYTFSQKKEEEASVVCFNINYCAFS